MATHWAVMENTFGFTSQELRDLQFVYKIFDVNGCGSIQGEEVRKALRLLAFKVTRVAVQQMLHDLQLSSVTIGIDTHGVTKARSKNSADFEDFLEIVAKLQGLSFDQHEEIMQAFSFIDSDEDGFISLGDLRKHALKIGLSRTDIQEMLAQADKDGDGMISKEEFFAVIKQTGFFH